MAKVSKRPLLQSVMDRAAEHFIPFQVSLELTHRCNLSCKHCYIDTLVQDELSFAEYRGILDQLANAGCLYLLLTGGELLTRSDFFDIASYAKERGFILMLLTNGTLITPEVARDIKKLEPVSVGMSLYGALPSTHESITGKRGSFEATIHGIEMLKSSGIKVELQALLMDSNVHEAEAIKDLAQELGVNLTFGYEFVPARSGSLSPYQYQAGSAELQQHINLLESEGDIDNTDKKNDICKAGKGICSITPTGDVFPCLLMPLKVGNLRQSSFEEIWKTNPSPELVYLRSLTWDALADCKECSLARYCKRCMGVAFVETGELTKPAPSACRNAALKSEFSKRKGVVP